MAQDPAFARIAPRQVAVAGGQIKIVGPTGYCVDRAASRDSRRGVFMLLGSCASIADDARAGAPQVRGVLTASVSAQSRIDVAGSGAQLQAFFTSRKGRAALARNRRSSSVTVLSTRQDRDMFIINARDTSRSRARGLSQIYWRGMLGVRGRIVTLSVFGFDKKPMTEVQGLTLLRAFASRIRWANSGPLVSAPDDKPS